MDFKEKRKEERVNYLNFRYILDFSIKNLKKKKPTPNLILKETLLRGDSEMWYSRVYGKLRCSDEMPVSKVQVTILKPNQSENKFLD